MTNLANFELYRQYRISGTCLYADDFSAIFIIVCVPPELPGVISLEPGVSGGGVGIPEKKITLHLKIKKDSTK